MSWKPTKPVLMLRTCDENRKGYGGFQWPDSGFVECPDWNPEPVCGGGLHGILWGRGNADHLAVNSPCWMVWEAEESEVVCIQDKHKAPRGNVLFCGSADDATNFLYTHPSYPSRSEVGYGGTATAGDGGTATAGVRGTATAGYGGTATAGYGGTATAGVRGTATAGDGGTATAGDGGTATAGDGGTIAILYWNGKRYKTKIAVTKDEDGDGELEPRKRYRLNSKHEWEEVV